MRFLATNWIGNPLSRWWTCWLEICKNARGCRVARQRLELHGFLGRQPMNAPLGVTELIPGSIVYEVSPVQGRPTLIRRVSTQGRLQTQLVWHGFGNFQWEVLQDTAEDLSETGGVAPFVETGELPPVPAVFEIGLVSESGRLLHREVVHHHAY